MLLLNDIAKEIVDNISLDIEIGYNLDAQDEETVLELLDEELHKLNRKNYSTDCGVSKLVIIPKDTSYVIKTPLFGQIEYLDAYLEEDGYVTDYDNPYFEYYSGAYFEGQDIDSSNYCELEEYLYECAVDAGVAEMFAKTEFYAIGKHNRPFYLSEKCYPFEWGRDVSDAASNLVRSKREQCTPGWCKMDSKITALFVDDYGVEKASKLFEFLSNYRISDLHSHNVMFSAKTGKIVISDYSGFYS